MEDKTKATESSMEEKQTIGRRELLKALAAGGGAVAASAVVSGKWVKPVVEAGVLPAHAATSTFTYFGNRSNLNVTASEVDDLGTRPTGPSAILVVVEGGIAYVQFNNASEVLRQEIDLDIGGSPSNDFKILLSCTERTPEKNPWNVQDYTLGDSTIKISNPNGESWNLVEVPEGTGPLPPICEED